MLSKRIANITPSATHAMTARIAEKCAAGESIITSSIGEPDFPTPRPIVEACEQALREGKTKYTATNGIAALREAVCEKLRRDNGLSYTPAQICISSGAKQALSNAVYALCDEGDEVLIPTPCYVSYVEIVKLAGGAPVLVPTDDDFSLNTENFRRAITARTKLILLNSPNNPTGAVYSRASLEALGRIAEENDLYVISDEVYEKLVYDGAEHVSIASVSDAMYGPAWGVRTENGRSKPPKISAIIFWMRRAWPPCSAKPSACRGRSALPMPTPWKTSASAWTGWKRRLRDCGKPAGGIRRCR